MNISRRVPQCGRTLDDKFSAMEISKSSHRVTRGEEFRWNWLKIAWIPQLQTGVPTAQETKPNPATGEGGIVYAELDLTQQQQSGPPRRLAEDKTEYAEILYTKPATEEQQETANE